VAGHVLGVADGGNGVGVGATACQGLGWLVIVPVVDAVVVGSGVHGLAGENLADDHLGGVAGIAQGGKGEIGAGLHVVGVLHGQGFELLDVGGALGLVGSVVVGFGVGGRVHGVGDEDSFPGFDVEALALGDGTLVFGGFADEIGGAVAASGAAVSVSDGEAPVGHGVIGFELQAPAEGAFGFVEPEGVEQGIALVEPLLDLGVFGGDGEVCRADAGHGPGLLAGSAVEGGAVGGVARFVSVGGAQRLGRGQCTEKSSHEPCIPVSHID